MSDKVKHSKAYYNFSRNMNPDQIKNSNCGRPGCIDKDCNCKIKSKEKIGFDEWLELVREFEQEMTDTTADLDD